MTKEEYEKNVIRMFDSIRNNHKGEKKCNGINCEDCPFDGNLCGTGERGFRAYEAIEMVERWAKENPVKTNSQKFEEVFGFKPLTNNCVKGEIKCKNCEYYDYGVCNASRFWEDEYKPIKEGEE